MKLVPASVSLKLSRTALQLKKNSPHIFFAGGIVGVVASTVLACRATLKLSETLDNIQEDINGVKGIKENIDNGQQGSYPTEQYNNDLAYVYFRSGMKLANLYAPAVILGAASIAALTSSHVQMTRRNAALMSAYALVQEAYDNYRERVRAELGEEKELDIYHAAKNETVKDGDGEKEIKKVDPNKWSPYARFFDEGSRHWEKNPEFNRLFIQCQQNYANSLLIVRGHIFLNEVYDMLDIPRSTAGSVVGWVIGKEGDNYVDFGLYEAYNSPFINGWERSILLDFNVDGVIYDKI